LKITKITKKSRKRREKKVIERIPANSKKTKKKKKEEQQEQQEENQIIVVNNIQLPVGPDQDLRTITLYGDITEKKGADVVAALLYLESSSHTALPKEKEDDQSADEVRVLARSISLVISTHGGTAPDMFSILDIMDMIKSRTCDIETFGIGKVMSAGVPILAAGSKGQRKIGRNCRIMLHNVMAGSQGTIFSMENELEEIKWTQERYIECLSNYTKLTKSKIKKLLKSQRDVYISAEEAIKMGIADEII
jgi:ATP-dependent Clp endopeptidase proteolytic subunit ClpP